MASFKSELEEVLEELGTAYHNNYPDRKAHKKAVASIIELVEEMLPKEKNEINKFGTYTVDELNQLERDVLSRLSYENGFNKALSDIRQKLRDAS